MTVETKVWPMEFLERFQNFLEGTIGLDSELNIEYRDAEDTDPANFHFVIFDVEQDEYDQIVSFEKELLYSLFSFEDLFSFQNFFNFWSDRISLGFKLNIEILGYDQKVDPSRTIIPMEFVNQMDCDIWLNALITEIKQKGNCDINPFNELYSITISGSQSLEIGNMSIENRMKSMRINSRGVTSGNYNSYMI